MGKNFRWVGGGVLGNLGVNLSFGWFDEGLDGWDVNYASERFANAEFGLNWRI